MQLLINEEEIDFTLQNEKTVNDILKNLEEQLDAIGQTTDTIIVDDELSDASNIENILDKPLDSVQKICIYTSPLSKLYYLALSKLKEAIDANRVFQETSQAFSYIKSVDSETANKLELYFREENFSVAKNLIEKYMRFFEEPAQRYDQAKKKLELILPNIEKIPVLFQTGRDKEIIETVAAFSELTTDFLSIIQLSIKTKCLNLKETVDEKTLPEFLEDFNVILSEFLTSMESGDTVLTGDLAEYELVPKTNALLSIAQNL